MTTNLTPRLTGIVQAVAEQRYDDTYTPTLEWANLEYDVNAALNHLIGSAAQQKSLAVGARQDFARNKALKVQYDRLDPDAGSQGVMDNAQPGFEPGGSVNVFSVALDFVF